MTAAAKVTLSDLMTYICMLGIQNLLGANLPSCLTFFKMNLLHVQFLENVLGPSRMLCLPFFQLQHHSKSRNG